MELPKAWQQNSEEPSWEVWNRDLSPLSWRRMQSRISHGEYSGSSRQRDIFFLSFSWNNLSSSTQWTQQVKGLNVNLPWWVLTKKLHIFGPHFLPISSKTLDVRSWSCFFFYLDAQDFLKIVFCNYIPKPPKKLLQEWHFCCLCRIILCNN